MSSMPHSFVYHTQNKKYDILFGKFAYEINVREYRWGNKT